MWLHGSCISIEPILRSSSSDRKKDCDLRKVKRVKHKQKTKKKQQISNLIPIHFCSINTHSYIMKLQGTLIWFLIHFRMNSAIWFIFLKKTDFTWTMGVTPHWSTSTWGSPSVLLHVPALPLIVWIVWVNLVVKTHETLKLWEFSASRRFNNRESCIFHSLIRTSHVVSLFVLLFSSSLQLPSSPWQVPLVRSPQRCPAVRFESWPQRTTSPKKTSRTRSQDGF